jgi:hypothetical protein
VRKRNNGVGALENLLGKNGIFLVDESLSLQIWQGFVEASLFWPNCMQEGELHGGHVRGRPSLRVRRQVLVEIANARVRLEFAEFT